MAMRSKEQILSGLGATAEVPEAPAPLRRLSFEDMVAAADLREEEVPIPQWNGTVVVRTLTKDELDKLAERSVRVDRRGNRQSDQKRFVALMAANSLVPPLTEEQWAQLGQKAGGAVGEIVTAALRINGVSEPATKSGEGADPD